MGTGKSKPVIDVICVDRLQRSLIVCPKSVIRSWQDQFQQHGTNAPRIVMLTGKSVAKRAALLQKLRPPYVIVTNYEAVWREPLGDVIRAIEWDVIVADECHRIKSQNGKASRFFANMATRARKRIGLSGTPMPHSPMDLWAQMRFIDAGVFGLAFYSFRQRYARMGGFNYKQVMGFKNLKELNRRFYSIAHRVTKDEVLDLPEFRHVKRTVELGPKGRKIYDAVEAEFGAWLEDSKTNVNAANALVKLLRLQQITGGSVTDEGGRHRRVDDSKKEALKDLLEDLPSNESVVVFCVFHDDLNAITEVALDCKRKAFELSGRKDNHWDWKDEEGAVIAVQIRAGSLGIDLTKARYVAFYSTGFSLGDYLQALSRVHRQGQKKAVTYFHLIADNTVDQKVHKALMDKKKVVDEVLTGFRAKATEISNVR